jgi:hypothetical protein
MKKGRMKKKVVIIACCCVFDTVEMKSPIPRVLNRKRQVARKRARRFRSGRSTSRGRNCDQDHRAMAMIV